MRTSSAPALPDAPAVFRWQVADLLARAAHLPLADDDPVGWSALVGQQWPADGGLTVLMDVIDGSLVTETQAPVPILSMITGGTEDWSDFVDAEAEVYWSFGTQDGRLPGLLDLIMAVDAPAYVAPFIPVHTSGAIDWQAGNVVPRSVRMIMQVVDGDAAATALHQRLGPADVDGMWSLPIGSMTCQISRSGDRLLLAESSDVLRSMVAHQPTKLKESVPAVARVDVEALIAHFGVVGAVAWPQVYEQILSSVVGKLAGRQQRGRGELIGQLAKDWARTDTDDWDGLLAIASTRTRSLMATMRQELGDGLAFNEMAHCSRHGPWTSVVVRVPDGFLVVTRKPKDSLLGKYAKVFADSDRLVRFLKRKVQWPGTKASVDALRELPLPATESELSGQEVLPWRSVLRALPSSWSCEIQPSGSDVQMREVGFPLISTFLPAIAMVTTATDVVRPGFLHYACLDRSPAWQAASDRHRQRIALMSKVAVRMRAAQRIQEVPVDPQGCVEAGWLTSEELEQIAGSTLATIKERRSVGRWNNNFIAMREGQTAEELRRYVYEHEPFIKWAVQLDPVWRAVMVHGAGVLVTAMPVDTTPVLHSQRPAQIREAEGF